MGLYDLSKPEDVADWLLSLPRAAVKDWGAWFSETKTPEFMDEVRKIYKEKNDNKKKGMGKNERKGRKRRVPDTPGRD